MQHRKKSSKPYPSRRARRTKRYLPKRQLVPVSSGREYKFFDTDITFNIDATGEVPVTGQLNLIPQGVTESTRVGRKCVIKSVQLRGVVTNNPTTGAYSSEVSYIYLVQDTQCNGAAAAITDVLTSTDMRNAMINLSNGSRFRILKRFVYATKASAGVTTAYDNNREPLDYYTKCNIPIEFSSTTGAIGEIKTNNLFLLAGSIGGDDTCSFAGTCRVRFSDN